jgi:hypothetical protein
MVNNIAGIVSGMDTEGLIKSLTGSYQTQLDSIQKKMDFQKYSLGFVVLCILWIVCCFNHTLALVDEY